ncbi:hypothetical protein PC121_g16493 [Phytophthora cactorum]|nr:hypothetical protein PC120_g15382 [Phytophthora cactorum]KAG3054028.1 hypothetical protein PC121_g16493 [Phytophthora cactorum]
MNDDTRDRVVMFISNCRELTFVRDKRASVQELWGGLQGFSLLQKVATRVFASASSSAADERNFSSHNFIHYSVRNAVKEGSVEKLIFIFFNAKIIGAEDIVVLTPLKTSREQPQTKKRETTTAPVSITK